jgi:hypothetical protein
VTLLAILLGCMSISIGKFTGGTTEEGVLCQEGEVSIPGWAEREVFYPVAYARPPHLEVGADAFELVEQKEDSFKVKNRRGFSETCRWQAKGVKATPASVAVPAPPAPPEPVGTGH